MNISKDNILNLLLNIFEIAEYAVESCCCFFMFYFICLAYILSDI